MTNETTPTTPSIDLVNGITIVSSGDACAADGSGCGCGGGEAKTAASPEPAAESGCGCGGHGQAAGGCGCGGHGHGEGHGHGHAHEHGHAHGHGEAAVATAPSATTTEFGVTGMTCGHCVASVTEEVGAIAGVTGVDVDLVNGGVSHVTVTSDSALDESAIKAAVEEAGYALA